MSVFIVNLICLLTVFITVTVVIMISRKLTNTIKLGRELSRELSDSVLHLEDIRKALLSQSQEICDESQKLEARLCEANKINKKINVLIKYMEESYLTTEKAYSEIDALKTNFFNDIEILKNEIENLSKYSKPFNKDFKLDTERKNMYTPLNLKSTNIDNNANLKPFPKKDNPFLFKTKFNKLPEK